MFFFLILNLRFLNFYKYVVTFTLRIFKFIQSFQAVLGLCCGAQPFSSCDKWGPLSSFLVRASCGCTQATEVQCVGSLLWLGLQSGVSVVREHGLSCSAACGVFPDHGSDQSLLNFKVDPEPLDHQGSPELVI